MNIRLFELIKSLTPEEKRHFKLSAKYGTAKNYIKLFDIIDAQESYDEKAIRKKYASENWIKNLSATKNYLYELIINNLQTINRANDWAYLILNGIQQVSILYKKNLFEHARIVLNKTISLAEEQGQILLKPLLMHWVLQLEGSEHNFAGKNLRWLYTQTAAYINSSKDSLLLARLYRCYAYLHYLQFKKSHSLNKEKLKSIAKKLQKIKPQVQPHLELMRLSCVFSAYKLLENCVFSYDALLDILNFFELQPHLKTTQPHAYISFLVETIWHATFTKNKILAADFFIAFNKIDSKNTHFKNIEQLIAASRCWLNLVFCIQEKNYSLGLTYIEDSKKFIANSAHLPLRYLLMIQYFAGCMSFLIGDYEQALEFWEIHLSKPLPIMKKIQKHTYLLNLICLYEIDKNLLPFAIGVSRRFLKKNKFYGDFERVWILFFSKMVRLDDKLSRADWQNLQQDLVLVIQSLEAQQAYSPLGFFPYLDWVEQQIHKN